MASFKISLGSLRKMSREIGKSLKGVFGKSAFTFGRKCLSPCIRYYQAVSEQVKEVKAKKATSL